MTTCHLVLQVVTGHPPLPDASATPTGALACRRLLCRLVLLREEVGLLGLERTFTGAEAGSGPSSSGPGAAAGAGGAGGGLDPELEALGMARSNVPQR